MSKVNKTTETKRKIYENALKINNYNSSTPLIKRIKLFFGVVKYTPFEEALFELLKGKLKSEHRVVLENQLNYFNHISRYLKPSERVGAYGYTEFHRTSFGKPVLEFEDDKLFSVSNKIFGSDPIFDIERKGRVLAEAIVSFNGGKITVIFKVYKGALCRLKFLSPSKIYYPPKNYTIEEFKLYLYDDNTKHQGANKHVLSETKSFA